MPFRQNEQVHGEHLVVNSRHGEGCTVHRFSLRTFGEPYEVEPNHGEADPRERCIQLGR